MDFHPAVIDVEHPSAGDCHMRGDSRDGQGIGVTGARCDRISLSRSSYADWFQDQVTLLCGHVAGIDVFALAGVQTQQEMQIAVVFGSDHRNSPGDCDAWVQQLESVWAVNVRMRIAARFSGHRRQRSRRHRRRRRRVGFAIDARRNVGSRCRRVGACRDQYYSCKRAEKDIGQAYGWQRCESAAKQLCLFGLKFIVGQDALLLQVRKLP